ncbi:MAG: fatty acid desaturase [Verrucomicrobiales bacterium]|nr:fatty acid desaturase [Verrucomicrobiales bacterium]
MNDLLIPPSPAPAVKPVAKTSHHRESMKEWKAIVAEFEKPNAKRAGWQIVNSIGLYIALWAVMYFTKSISWGVTIPIAVIAGLVLVRIFIISHDCGHGSFLKSKRANNFWGFVSGLFVFTPYFHWRWEHSVHHATSGHLDRRGIGDVWTLTVKEYEESSRWQKFAYALVRHPIVLLGVAPTWLFLLRERFATKGAKPRERQSVWYMNLAVVSLAATLIAIFGLKSYLIIQLITILIAATCGVWLFYVQHQYEDTYWAAGDEWDYTTAAIEGSSFYKLPKVLQWFSGNIGFHHIHHLSSRIPNYNLERCHNSHPMFHDVKPLLPMASLKCMHYRLWDQENKRLITFQTYKEQLRDKEQLKAAA